MLELHRNSNLNESEPVLVSLVAPVFPLLALAKMAAVKNIPVYSTRRPERKGTGVINNINDKQGATSWCYARGITSCNDKSVIESSVGSQSFHGCVPLFFFTI